MANSSVFRRFGASVSAFADAICDSRFRCGGRVFRRETREGGAGRHLHRARRASRGDSRQGSGDAERQARRFRGASAAAESDTAKIGPVDVAIVSVKAYDNATALPMLKPLIGPDTVVLTLQNGVDSVDEVRGDRRRAARARRHHLRGDGARRARADRADRRASLDHFRRGVRRSPAASRRACRRSPTCWPRPTFK